jgi:hypothetical protein
VSVSAISFPRILESDSREVNGVGDDDGEEVRLEGVTVHENLSDDRRRRQCVLDAFQSDVLALGQFHDVLRNPGLSIKFVPVVLCEVSP